MTPPFQAYDIASWPVARPDPPAATRRECLRPRILIVQPPLPTRPLRSAVQHLMPQAVVSVVTPDANGAVRGLRPDPADLVILSGCDTCSTVPSDWLASSGIEAPRARIVICYSECTRLCAQSLIRSGVSALVPDDVSPVALVQIIQLVLAGLRYAPPDLIVDCTAAPPPPMQAELSRRERQVAEFLARGQSNKEIARRLGVSEITIKVHVSNLLRKLQARNRTEAATHLLAAGLVAPAEPPPAI